MSVDLVDACWELRPVATSRFSRSSDGERRSSSPILAMVSEPVDVEITCGVGGLTTCVEEHPAAANRHDHHVRMVLADRLVTPPAVG
jgi:hypothetical protein